MEGITHPASPRLARYKRAHPEAVIHPVGAALVAWVPDESDPFSGSVAVDRAGDEDKLAAKLDGG